MKILSLAFIIFLTSQVLFAQSTDSLSRKNALNIFLDSYHNTQFIKENITFVNYVRDVKDADVYVLEITQSAGNGGEEFSYIFTGNHKYIGKNDTLKFYTTADNTIDEIRQKQVQILKIGLMQYVAHTPYANEIDIVFSDNFDDEITEDKWRSWVFELNASGSTSGEDSYKSYNLESSISAQKITEKWKIEIKYSNYNYLSYYYFDDDTISSQRVTNYFRSLVALSIGNHWALGFNCDFGNSTYNNKKLFTGFWPTIEYNVFQYSKSNIIQLRFQYLFGPKYYKYYETTIYDKHEDLLYSERLGVAFQINKKWGSINTSVSGEHYFHDFSKNRLNFDNELEIRIIKGLSVYLYGSYSIINDQIFLPKGDLSYEDILLRQQQASTNYSYWGFVGFSYTFGSIYNNVVNPRFNSIY
ncbi:MAG: hypothetical protein JXL97_19630 [Bacteroidales bacterium]|nr:hypothetical protein [Bacteroidales bacterium]